jgi:two-component system sensor histidine kinase/response regulator
MKDLLPPEIADKQLTHIRHVITKGESLVLEAPNLINGRTRWFLNNIQPVRDSSGQALLAMVNSQDITERKRAEEKLQENERTLKLFVDYAPAAIAMFDLDMKYIAFSRRYIIDYRLHDENLVGRSHYEVFPETPERWKEILRGDYSAKASGEGNFRKRTPDEGTCYFFR